MRVTKKALKSLLKQINEATNSPLQTYKEDKNGKLVGQIGNYYLHSAYNKYMLVRVIDEHSGVATPAGEYFFTQNEMFYILKAYLAGIQDGKQLNNQQTIKK